MRRILLATYDVALGRLIEQMFELEGDVVYLVTSSDEAFALLDRTPYQLIAIIEHLMPYRSGMDVLHEVAGSPSLRRQHQYILISTIPAHSREQMPTLPNGFRAPIVPMPFDVTVLIGEVDAAAHRLHEEARRLPLCERYSNSGHSML